MKNEKTKKSNLKPVRQNKEKKSTKSTAKKTVSNSIREIIKIADKAESLRLQNEKDMRKMDRITDNWTNRLKKCTSAVERDKVNCDYQKKFNKAEKVESASYKAYYDYVHKNFTTEQQKKAMAKSKDFSSKKYTNALRGTDK